MRRAALLVPVLLAVWWFALKAPSLAVLRAAAWLPLALLVAPNGMDPVRVDAANGDWMFNVAVDEMARNAQTGVMERVTSVEFAAEPNRVAPFAAGWFTYLALALSARGSLRRVAAGLGIQTVVNVLGLALYAYISGHWVLIDPAAHGQQRSWLMQYAYHINDLVVPFAGPFLLALAMHRELRAYFDHMRPRPEGRPSSR